MVKADAQSDRSKTEPAIRDRIVLATIETLKTDGFAGTSARAIARRGEFNQALIFYHFGTVPDLLLAALDRVSTERLARYQSALGDARTLTELANWMADLFAEDMANQHITAVQELVAGSSSNPDLGREIVSRLEPWIEFVEDVVERMLSGTPFEELLPKRQVAYAGIALIMGMETLTHLDGDRSQAAELFATATGLAPMLDLVLAAGTTGGGNA